MLGGGEFRIGVGEVHHAYRVGVGYEFADRPLGDQRGCSNLVVVVPQERHVQAQEVSQVSQHGVADVHRAALVGDHQLSGDADDDFVQGARHALKVTSAGGMATGSGHCFADFPPWAV